MKRDLWVAIGWAIIGIWISSGSVRLGLWRMGGPDAGLYPLLIGLGIILLSVILLCVTIWGKRAGQKENPLLGPRWKNLFLILGGLLFYFLALDRVGFPLTTFLFMTFVLKAIEPQRWPPVLLLSFFSTSACYVVFSLWIKIEFPKGILGF